MIAVIRSSSTGSATNSSASGIAESRISAHQPAQIPSIYTATPCRINVLPPSLRIAGSNILKSSSEAAAIESRDIIKEPYVRNAPLYLDLHANWARLARINITWDQLGHQTAAREQSFDERLYHTNMEKVRFVNNCHVRAAFIANHQTVFQVPSSLLRDYFGLASCLEVCLLETFTR